VDISITLEREAYEATLFQHGISAAAPARARTSGKSTRLEDESASIQAMVHAIHQENFYESLSRTTARCS